MAVNPISVLQGPFNSGIKPSRALGEDLFVLADADRRRSLKFTGVQAGRLAAFVTAPWAGVIEEIGAVQQVAGGGAGGQNTIDVQVGQIGALASVYAAGADGNLLLDNDVAGTQGLCFPTAVAGVGRLQLCTDGEYRAKFVKGDTIYVVLAAGAGALGTVDVEVVIAKELPPNAL